MPRSAHLLAFAGLRSAIILRWRLSVVGASTLVCNRPLAYQGGTFGSVGIVRASRCRWSEPSLSTRKPQPEVYSIRTTFSS